MKNVRQLLILSNPHPDGVTDNFAYSLATAALADAGRRAADCGLSTASSLSSQ